MVLQEYFLSQFIYECMNLLVMQHLSYYQDFNNKNCCHFTLPVTGYVLYIHSHTYSLMEHLRKRFIEIGETINNVFGFTRIFFVSVYILMYESLGYATFESLPRFQQQELLSLYLTCYRLCFIHTHSHIQS